MYCNDMQLMITFFYYKLTTQQLILLNEKSSAHQCFGVTWLKLITSSKISFLAFSYSSFYEWGAWHAQSKTFKTCQKNLYSKLQDCLK